MRVEGMMILHYGADYCRYAAMSVLDHLDRLHIAYVPHPSHGSRTDLPCPETRQQLLDCFSGLPKIAWHDVDFWREGQHRDYALSLCKGDLALVVDADEVWDPDVLEACLKWAWDGSVQTWRLNFTHLWRSFSWACTDGMWPDRIQDKRYDRKERYGYLPKDLGDQWHFGYAVRTEILRYKAAIHGHVGEWREAWWDKWDAWPPVEDVHPTCLNTWFPQPIDKGRLPAVLTHHPFVDLEPIP